MTEKQEIELIVGSDECRSLIRKKRRVVSQLNKRRAFLLTQAAAVDSASSPAAAASELKTADIVELLESQLRQLNSLEALMLVGIVSLKDALSGAWNADPVVIDQKMLKKIQLASLGAQEEASKALDLDSRVHLCLFF